METPTTPATAAPSPSSTRKHHKYGPSRLNYLDECAAFTSRSGTSEAAEEGTFLHDIMEKVLTQVKKGRAATCLEQISGWVTKSFPELEEEQLVYLRFCSRRCDVFIAKKPNAIHTEISVSVKHPDGKELNHGFLDVLFVFKDTGILQDFKFGGQPVKPASKNLQGFNYVLGCFQKFPFLNRIGAEFIQPKLNWVSSHLFQRKQTGEIYQRLKTVIDQAEFVQDNPKQAQQFMKPGGYCNYCALNGECAVLNNHRAVAVSKYHALPVPPAFSGLVLEKPEDFALARYYIDIIEQGFDGLKTRAFEVAKANGGELRCTLPNGEEVVYELASRSSNRVLGNAVEVAEALKDVVTEKEVLGAAELAITKLEPIVKTAMVDLAKARGEKLTKKAAWEQAQATLEANGVLSRSDVKIEYLRQRKEVKQITESSKNGN